MKVVFCVVLLCISGSHFTLASPISQNEDISMKILPASEGLVEKVAIPNGYVTTPGVGTHKIHHLQQKTWNEARITCLNEGAHLAIINSAAEETLLINHMKTAQYGQLWLGLHELFNKDDWVSETGSRLDAIGYVHWQPNQPDSTPNEHCATLTQWGMNDYVCQEKLFFVCEI